ncbi:hypothetical protein EV183_004866 [Coemansia sp. RSA 2336]|nr:hypothetical protein EV183_004866 [Coemansia sp. RSA 2336]
MSSDTEAATKAKPVKRKTSAEIKRARLERLRIAREGSQSTQQQAHEYLQTWKSQPNAWKFNKARQLWIIRHLYVESQIPTDIFHIAVNYLNQSSDSLRQTLVNDAHAVINPAMDKSDEQKRARVLGQMPSHVTKGEAKALKKKKRDLAAGKLNEETKDAEEDGSSEISLGIRERAQCIVDTLSKPKPDVDVKDSSSEIISEKSSKKRKLEDAERESDEVKKEKKKKEKKAKKEKKDKEVKDKKEKKNKKDKKEKKDKKDKKDKKVKDKEDKKKKEKKSSKQK